MLQSVCVPAGSVCVPMAMHMPQRPQRGWLCARLSACASTCDMHQLMPGKYACAHTWSLWTFVHGIHACSVHVASVYIQHEACVVQAGHLYVYFSWQPVCTRET